MYSILYPPLYLVIAIAMICLAEAHTLGTCYTDFKCTGKAQAVVHNSGSSVGVANCFTYRATVTGKACGSATCSGVCTDVKAGSCVQGPWQCIKV